MPGPIPSGVEKPQIPSTETTIVQEREAFESALVEQEGFLEKTDEQDPGQAKATEAAMTSAVPTPVQSVVVLKDEVTIEVEKLLEEGLGDFYATLTPAAKIAFKQKGEIAAVEISTMVRSLHLQVKRALKLIRDWLLTIPSVNRFFLEQEAKIKVDLIQELIEARKEDASKKV